MISLENLATSGFVPIKYDQSFKIEDDRYLINPSGTIYDRNIKSFIVPKEDKDGYFRVDLHCDNGNDVKHFGVHRLVAYTFLGNPPNENKTIVDHINRDRKNNNVLNLRWSTAEENANNRSNPLTSTQLNKLKAISFGIKNGNTSNEMIEELGVDRASFWKIVNGDAYQGMINELCTSDEIDRFKERMGCPTNDRLSYGQLTNICKDLELAKDLRDGEIRPLRYIDIAQKHRVSLSTVKSIAQKRIYKDIVDKYDFGKNMFQERLERREPILTAFRLGVSARELRTNFGVKTAYEIYADFIKNREEIAYTQNNHEFSINDVNENSLFSNFSEIELSHQNMTIPKESKFVKRLENTIPLTDIVVHKLCNDLENGNYKFVSDLADRYNTTTGTVYDIKMGRSYKHISCQYNISKERNESAIISKEGILNIAKDIQDSKAGCIYTEPVITLADIAKKYGVTETFVKQIAKRTMHGKLTKDFDFGLTQKERRNNRRNLVYSILDFGIDTKTLRSLVSFCMSASSCDSYKLDYENSGRTPKFKLSEVAHTVFDINENNSELPGFSDFK